MQDEFIGNHATIAGKKGWEPHWGRDRQEEIDIDLGSDEMQELWETIKENSLGRDGEIYFRTV